MLSLPGLLVNFNLSTRYLQELQDAALSPQEEREERIAYGKRKFQSKLDEEKSEQAIQVRIN